MQQKQPPLVVLANKLVLVRHGESEWNKKNLFTGWRDPDLTEKGFIEARWAGRVLKQEGIRFDIAFTSMLRRAQNTLAIILGEMGQDNIEIVRDQALNERDYGDLSGLNKEEARQRWGDDMVHKWRRSFDIPPPGGESLKMTAERVLPYYKSRIWPELKAGRNVIVAAHGNSLRALIMHLESLSGEEIIARELATGAPMVFQLHVNGGFAGRRDLVRQEGRDSGI